MNKITHKWHDDHSFHSLHTISSWVLFISKRTEEVGTSCPAAATYVVMKGQHEVGLYSSEETIQARESSF